MCCSGAGGDAGWAGVPWTAAAAAAATPPGTSAEACRPPGRLWRTAARSGCDGASAAGALPRPRPQSAAAAPGHLHGGRRPAGQPPGEPARHPQAATAGGVAYDALCSNVATVHVSGLYLWWKTLRRGGLSVIIWWLIGHILSTWLISYMTS